MRARDAETRSTSLLVMTADCMEQQTSRRESSPVPSEPPECARNLGLTTASMQANAPVHVVYADLAVPAHGSLANSASENLNRLLVPLSTTARRIVRRPVLSCG